MLRDLDDAIRSRDDFIYETTLSSHQSIELLRHARHAGYEIGLIFVALRDVELNIARVAQRALQGGHNIPEPIIRRRYHTAMMRLVDALRLVDAAVIFDNSALSHPVELLWISHGIIGANRLNASMQLHRRIAASVGAALGLDAERVLLTGRG